MKQHRNDKPVFLLAALSLLCETAMASEASVDAERSFFSQFVVAGGPIVWLVLLPLSVLMLYLAVDLFLTIRRRRLLPAGVRDRILNLSMQQPAESFIAQLSTEKDLVSRSVAYSLRQTHNLAQEKKSVDQFAAESLTRQSVHLMRKVEWCGIIGNVAPMVGLFGTVFGMISAFNILGVSGGQPRPDELAAKISLALITTFWGLLVAIPALAIHGVFSNRMDSYITEAAVETQSTLRNLQRQKIGRTLTPSHLEGVGQPDGDNEEEKTATTVS